MRKNSKTTVGKKNKNSMELKSIYFAAIIFFERITKIKMERIAEEKIEV